MTFEQLVIELRLNGAQPTKQQLKDVREEVRNLEGALQSLGTFGGISYLISQIGEIAGAFVEVSGMRIAGQFMGIARALEAITGSASKASRFMQQFKDLGRKTTFDTADIAGMGAKMLGAGVSESRVVPELTALVDLASHGMGIDRADMPEFMRNLLQIRGRGTGRADMADINQLKDRVPQVGRFFAAGMGGKDSPEEALKKAQSLTGREFYDTLIRGAQAMAKGAAAARAANDPFARFANILETLRMTMEPTGRILLALSRPFLGLAEGFSNFFLDINKWTGGLAGLGGIIGGVLFVATRHATVALYDFAKAMMAVSASTKTATATATAGGAAAGAAASTATSGGAAVGIAATIGAAIMRILPIFGWSYVGYETFKQATDPEGKTGFRGEAAAHNARMKEIMDKARGAKTEEAKAKNPVVDEQKKTNELLKDLKLQAWGGGARSARAMSDFEAQWAVSKMLAI